MEPAMATEKSKVWWFFTISTADEHKAICKSFVYCCVQRIFALQNTIIGIGYRLLYIPRYLYQFYW